MINALHLLWIIPTSGAFGMLISCLLCAAKNSDCDDYDRSNSRK